MGIRTTIKKWAAYQQTVRELTALDSRQLSDLGINRADIQRVARDHARTIWLLLMFETFLRRESGARLNEFAAAGAGPG